MKYTSPAQLLRTLAAMCALTLTATASAADIHVMISAGFHKAYSEQIPAFERESGHRVVTVRGPSMGDSPEANPARLSRGEAADVVILDGGAADSKVVLARSLVGMVVREGTPKPDITSVDAFHNALLAAKSIAYSDSGSGTYLSTKLFAKLGVADQVAGKSRSSRARRGGDRLPNCSSSTRKSAQPQAMTDTTTPRLMHYVI